MSKKKEIQTLSVSYSWKSGDNWINKRVGSAWISDDGKRVDIKLDFVPTGNEGRFRVWLEPYEEK